MKNILVLFGFILIGQVVRAQTDSQKAAEKEWLRNQPNTVSTGISVQAPSKPYPTAETLKKNANSHIKAMKDGVLLVRLRTSDLAINRLMEAGNEGMANTIRRQQEAANLRLLTAFRQNFTFIPVYFFYSTDSEKVKNKDTAGILLNDRLQRDASIVLPDKNIYVAEITELEQFRPDHDNPNYSNNAEVSFKALVLRDSSLHQLAKPFPFFIKNSTTIPPRRRSEAEMVSLLDQKLQAFYNQHMSGRRK